MTQLIQIYLIISYVLEHTHNLDITTYSNFYSSPEIASKGDVTSNQVPYKSQLLLK